MFTSNQCAVVVIWDQFCSTVLPCGTFLYSLILCHLYSILFYVILVQSPQFGERDKKMNLFSSGSLSFKVHIEKTGYRPGKEPYIFSIKMCAGAKLKIYFNVKKTPVNS